MPKDIISIYRGRVNEDFLLEQFDYHAGRESYRDQKSRIEEGDRLYAGKLKDLYPSETALPDIPLVENKYKNAIHDIARLAASARGAPHCLPRGDADSADRNARLREAALETTWQMNRMRRVERRLYMDAIGAGAMCLNVWKERDFDYARIGRMNPRYCYPDIRNDELSSLVFAEVMKEREAAYHFPDADLNIRAEASDTVTLVGYYDQDESVECIIKEHRSGERTANVTQRWEHHLGMPTVAFVLMPTFDGNIRGLLDQMGGPMMVRNKIVKLGVDALEQSAHAGLFIEGIENADDAENMGPTTILRGDPNAERTTVARIPPAQASSDPWRLLAYMDDQEQKEALQPPARVGSVKQSIASGSFVASTQGQLTSVVEELQEQMAELRRQAGVIAATVECKYLNFSKPLVRTIQKQKAYVPDDVFRKFYEHEILYGAGAGLDKINAENRLLNLLSARVISKKTFRNQVDFLTDGGAEQEDIDAENVADALLQRFATDPATPMQALAAVMEAMAGGASLVEAMGQVAPQLAAPAGPEAQPGQPLPEGETLPEGAPVPAESGIASGDIGRTQQLAPLQQVFVR